MKNFLSKACVHFNDGLHAAPRFADVILDCEMVFRKSQICLIFLQKYVNGNLGFWKIDKSLTLQNLVTRRIRQSPTENFNFRVESLPSPGKHPATSGPSVKTCLLWKVTLLVIRRIRQPPAEKINSGKSNMFAIF